MGNSEKYNHSGSLARVPAHKVNVKRKYIIIEKVGRKAVRWWFVLRATEDILQNLEDQWERIKIQMSWKLEPVVYIQCHQGRWGRYLCSDSEFMVFQVMHLWQFNLYRWLFLTMALLPLYKQSLSKRRGKKHLSECSHSCGGRKLTQFQFTK